MTVIARHELHCEWCEAVTTVDVGLGYGIVDGGGGLLHAGHSTEWVLVQLPVDPGRVECADVWVSRLRVACPEHRPLLAEYAKELWHWQVAKSERAQERKEAEDTWLWANRQPVLELPETKAEVKR